jgi:8-oxo-dGTP pyrophosphatase MutT (NUDIX family)
MSSYEKYDLNNQKKRIAAGAVILKTDKDNNQYMLVIQRSEKDHWPLFFEFPRGGCDKPVGEHIEHCIKREVKEETNLDIEIIKFIDSFDYYSHKYKQMTRCLNYLCKVIDNEQQVVLSKEHIDYQWISSFGQIELMLLPEQKKTVSKVFNLTKQIVNYPTKTKTKQGVIEEYLDVLQQTIL